MKAVGYLALPAIWQEIPVVLNSAGTPVVPLKRVCEALGLRWDDQWVKTTNWHLRQRAGLCLATVSDGSQGRSMTCIRADRVGTFINTINPKRLHANSNSSSAALIEKLQTEWDAILASQLGTELRMFKF